MPNVLRIRIVPRDAVNLDGVPTKVRLWDCVIDYRPLAEHLGVAHCGRDLCGSPLAWIGYRRYRDQLADCGRQLTGAAPADNQFCRGRVVLYHCHCGCHYCGVLSARVERSAGIARWRDVGLEDRTGVHGTAAFCFNTRQIAAAVARILQHKGRRGQT
jgi:hypothetical protein